MEKKKKGKAKRRGRMKKEKEEGFKNRQELEAGAIQVKGVPYNGYKVLE